MIYVACLWNILNRTIYQTGVQYVYVRKVRLFSISTESQACKKLKDSTDSITMKIAGCFAPQFVRKMNPIYNWPNEKACQSIRNTLTYYRVFIKLQETRRFSSQITIIPRSVYLQWRHFPTSPVTKTNLYASQYFPFISPFRISRQQQYNVIIFFLHGDCVRHISC